ncbi:MAG TPA: methionyl-tRNA formyltransferase [Acidimicrobiia bacterium]|nr:methionyl-tRNA formyltransferase [Acidimicrobiia bacterium]
MTRIVFLGTPGAAVPTLETLAHDFDIGLVVTRPDRPRGRSRRVQPSPVKVRADELGLMVRQPSRPTELAGLLRDAGHFDVGVVVAFGMILDPEALVVPDRGMLNVHFSLLPRWRGAAPVARALMAGDPMSGVTIIRLNEGLDTGPVLTAQAVDILKEETAGELTGRLSALGARLLEDVLPGYLAGEVVPVPQVDEGAAYAAKLGSDERPLRPTMSRVEAVNRVRALSPTPAATLDLDGETHKVLRAQLHPLLLAPGSLEVVDGHPVIGMTDGGVELVAIQPPGKRAMPGPDWARGRHGRAGSFQ